MGNFAMFSITLRHFTIHSSLAPSTIKNRLTEIVLPHSPPLFLWKVPSGKLYYGTMSDNSFHLKSLWHHQSRNLWIPTFYGSIHHTPIGSDILIFASMEGFDAIAIIVYHLFILLMLAIGIKVGLPLFLFVLTLFSLADGLGYYMGVVRGIQFFEEEINFALSK